jgi:hypothetical protein
VARILGTVWETHEAGDSDGAAENYVFRWNRQSFRDVARSYLLKEASDISVIRFWDHNVTLRRLARVVGDGRLGLTVAKSAYRVLDAGMWWMGNAIVGIVVKGPVTSGNPVKSR